MGIVGEALLFPQLYKPTKPVSKDDVSKWAIELERTAGVAHLERGVWHPYRRKWGFDRKAMPVADVMAAGGWDDYRTFVTSYNKADYDTMLEVMRGPRRKAVSVANLANLGKEIRRRPASGATGSKVSGARAARESGAAPEPRDSQPELRVV
jgi:hypothetical protein